MKDRTKKKNTEDFNFTFKKLQKPICGIKGPLPIVNKYYDYKKRLGLLAKPLVYLRVERLVVF